VSNMIPQETVDAFHSFNDVSIDNYGIACKVYVLTNPAAIVGKGIYAAPEDMSFTEYDVKVFINWTPTMKQLRLLGLFAEDALPIIAWFQNAIFLPVGSYIKIDMQYIPKKYSVDEFEIVDAIIKNMHDSELSRCYKVAPRRVGA